MCLGHTVVLNKQSQHCSVLFIKWCLKLVRCANVGRVSEPQERLLEVPDKRRLSSIMETEAFQGSKLCRER